MTQEDLLLQDLSSRLPHLVKVFKRGNEKISGHLVGIVGNRVTIFSSSRAIFEVNDIVPYLFPLYRMTKKQKEEFYALYWEAREKAPDYLFDFVYSSIKSNWLYKNHFDINGLIPLGLAKDATGLNIY